MRRTSKNGTTGDFTVAGDDRQWPTLGAAISRAQARVSAERGEEFLLGIFERGQQVALVESFEDGSITTRRLNGGAS